MGDCCGMRRIRRLRSLGGPGGTVPLYASALGADRIAYATPGDLQTLQFPF
jgi:hypothetical protein